MRTPILQPERRKGAYGQGPTVGLERQKPQPTVTAVAAMVRASAEALGVEEHLVHRATGVVPILTIADVRAHLVPVQDEPQVGTATHQ